MKEIKITEKQFTQQVIQLLKICGFDDVYHTWNSLHSQRGFPDIVAIRIKDRCLLYAELKSDKGELTPDQAIWIADLRYCGQEVYLWRPMDWDEIVKICRMEKEE